MWILSTFMFFLGVQLGWTTQSCDKYKGPLGTIECLQFKGFEDQYQWATCLTSAHIQQQSGHTRICEDRTRTYCWFTCMGEVHGVSSGSVASDCSCDPHRSSPTSSLPRECYHPSGDNCYWYRTCWEKKYPCKPSDNGYVIRYAEKFCRVVEEHKAKLSPDAQEWMEAVRKCLQVDAASLLDDRIGTGSLTCNQIKEKELNSYTACYLNPGNGASSICDLHCWQHSQIFWSIKESFTKLDTAWESFKGLWNIETKCPSFNTEENSKCFQQHLQGVIKFLKINIENLLTRKRRASDPNSNVDVLSRFADEVGSAIASSLNWKTDVMDWIAYTAHWVGFGNLDIVIMLADKKALGIVTGSIPRANFGPIIQDFASAVRKGKLRLQVQGYNVWVKSLSSCSDKSCDTTRTLATSNTPPWSSRPSSATEISHDVFCLCGVSALWIMLLNMCFQH